MAGSDKGRVVLVLEVTAGFEGFDVSANRTTRGLDEVPWEVDGRGVPWRNCSRT